MSWPPTLDELKDDMRIALDDTRDDARLSTVLDAAVAFVEDKRRDVNYSADPVSTLPDPEPDLILGTLRLAARWHARRRSVDGLVAMGDLGSGRVPGVDRDIERMLRIGAYRRARVG